MPRVVCAVLILVLAWLTAGITSAAGKNGWKQMAEIKINIYLKRQRVIGDTPGGDGVPVPLDVPPTPFGEVVDELLKKRCTPDLNLASQYEDFLLRNAASLGISPPQEAQLTAAMVSQDGKAALELTAVLRQAPDMLTRSIANLVALQVWRESGQMLTATDAKPLFAALECDASSMANPLKADYAYLRALAALERADSANALKYAEEAAALDPQFFNPHAVRVALLVELAERASLGGDVTCHAAYGKLAHALYDIMALAPCPMKAAHLARYVRSQQSTPDQHMSLLLTEAALSAIFQHKLAFLDKKEKLHRIVDSGAACGRFILDNVADLEKRVPSISSDKGGAADVPVQK
jgi:hypothetical protein